MTKTLIMLAGLPRSGKSTYAEFLQEHYNYPIVNPDTLRLNRHGKAFDPQYEKEIWQWAGIMINSLFDTGSKIVVLDATNITEKQRNIWKSTRYQRDIRYFTTAKDICIQRAKETNKEYLVDVIERMSGVYKVPTNDELDLGDQLYKVDTKDIIYLGDKKFKLIYKAMPQEAN